MRLQKYLALSGVASRRKSEDIIRSGRVRINNSVINEMGFEVNPEKDIVTVDGNIVRPYTEHEYYMLNKPRSVVCTCSDERGRKTVADFFEHIDKRLFPVGRLDYDSEGIVLMTSDGEFANIVTHPSNGIKKAYRATIDKHYDSKKAEQIKEGVDIGDDRPAQALSVSFNNRIDGRAQVTLEIGEGRKREVRRMLEAQGYNVLRLVRFRIGSLEIGRIAPGKYVKLTREQAYMATKNKD